MLYSLLGGALIGAAASLFWFRNRRVAGISGVLRGALRSPGDRAELGLFLAGLIAAGLIASALAPTPAPTDQPLGVLVAAGLLVGAGTRAGGGCTSGHGVCGISRLVPRSMAATLVFMLTAAVTVAVVARVAPAWGVR